MSEKIFTSWNLNCACGVKINKRRGNETAPAKIILASVFFQLLSNCLHLIRNRKKTKIGRKTRDVLKVFMAATKERRDKTKNFMCLLSLVEYKKRKTPSAIKKVATFASKAALESKICHGDIASKNDEPSAIYSFFLVVTKSSNTKK